jgi:hypothetical protein
VNDDCCGRILAIEHRLQLDTQLKRGFDVKPIRR